MGMNEHDLAVSIRNAALDCGYAGCGIVRTAAMEGYAGAVAERVGHFPESGPMYTPLLGFARPEDTVPWARSVVVCVVWYGTYRIPDHLEGTIGKSFCVDPRRDPRSREYQDRKRFEAALDGMGVRHESKSDFGITALRWAAAKAGLGIIRKNNFFYTEKGSWCRLDAFCIDRELELTAVPAVKPCPEQCGLCIKACPTRALSAPFRTNGVACVSFLTSRGTCGPGKPYYGQCGGWIFGCDACQDACPHNKNAWSGTDDFPGLAELAPSLSYERLLAMDYAAMRDLLPQKFWYIAADDVWKWKCNVLNAMHNRYDDSYLPHLERAELDAKEEVRAMAQWVRASVTASA